MYSVCHRRRSVLSSDNIITLAPLASFSKEQSFLSPFLVIYSSVTLSNKILRPVIISHVQQGLIGWLYQSFSLVLCAGHGLTPACLSDCRGTVLLLQNARSDLSAEQLFRAATEQMGMWAALTLVSSITNAVCITIARVFMRIKTRCSQTS